VLNSHCGFVHLIILSDPVATNSHLPYDIYLLSCVGPCWLKFQMGSPVAEIGWPVAVHAHRNDKSMGEMPSDLYQWTWSRIDRKLLF
jgi:hypothetical protein